MPPPKKRPPLESKGKAKEVGAPEPEPGTISAEKLCALTGLSDMRHRQLAKEGFFPPPIKAQYQLTATVQGMFRHFREMNQRARGSLNDEKLAKTAAERQFAELELKRELRALLPARDVERAWAFLLQGVRSRWLQLPARSVLEFSLWADARGAERWLEEQVQSILADLASNPDYSPRDEDQEDAGTAST